MKASQQVLNQERIGEMGEVIEGKGRDTLPSSLFWGPRFGTYSTDWDN